LFIFPVPLVSYLALLRLNATISPRGFVVLLAGILLFLFLSSTEIFATTTVFGALTIAISYLIFERETRHRLRAVVKETACVYALLAALLAPFLYYVFAQGLPRPFNDAAVFSNNLLAFAVPPPIIFLGGYVFGSLFHHFLETIPWWEQAAYLGPGLWLTIFLFAWSYWRTRVGKLLVFSLALIAVASLGPTLNFANRALVPMPWWLFNKLPLID